MYLSFPKLTNFSFFPLSLSLVLVLFHLLAYLVGGGRNQKGKEEVEGSGRDFWVMVGHAHMAVSLRRKRKRRRKRNEEEER